MRVVVGALPAYVRLQSDCEELKFVSPGAIIEGFIASIGL